MWLRERPPPASRQKGSDPQEPHSPRGVKAAEAAARLCLHGDATAVGEGRSTASSVMLTPWRRSLRTTTCQTNEHCRRSLEEIKISVMQPPSTQGTDPKTNPPQEVRGWGVQAAGAEKPAPLGRYAARVPRESGPSASLPLPSEQLQIFLLKSNQRHGF